MSHDRTKIGVIVSTDGITSFTFKVFEDQEDKVGVGSFVTFEMSGLTVLARTVSITRRNYLLDDRLISGITERSLEVLRDYGIDIEYISTSTLARAVIVGAWNGRRVESVSRPPKLFTYVYLPLSEDLEQILKVRADGVYANIGHVKNYPDLSAYLDLSKLITHHCAILAATGSGKSWLAGVIAEEICLRTRVPVVIFDPHSEYSAMQVRSDKIGVDLSQEERELADRICSSVEIYVPGKVSTSSVDEHFEKRYGVRRRYTRFGLSIRSMPFGVLLKLLDYYYGLSEAQRRVLEECWQYINPYTSNEVADIDEVIEEIYRYGRQVVPRGRAGDVVIESLAAKLRMLFENRPFFILKYGEHYGGEPIRLLSVKDVISRPGIKVFDLSGLDLVDQQALMTIVLDEILGLATRRAAGPVFVIIEEAHNFAPSRGDAISLPSILKIAREGRKFGVGLCIVSQRPSRVHPDVLSQCMTQIFKRIINPADLKYVREVVESATAESMWEIRLLNENEALVTGLAVPIALPVVVRKRLTAHGGVTPRIS